MKSLLVSYCKLCIEGKNIRHQDNIRSGTISGYMLEVNALFKKRNLPMPIDFKDSEDMVNILVSNLAKEEDIANQRSPFTPQMVNEFFRRGQTADPDSLEALVLDIIKGGRGMGYRASETSTTTNSRPDYYTYPGSRRKVVKAVCEDWWMGYDENGNAVDDVVADEDRVEKLKILWKFQKNRRNNEPVSYKRNRNSEFCMVTTNISMIKRARRLGQREDLPLCVYRDANGRMKYLTSSDLTKYIREVAKAAHPSMTKKEIMKFSCHSIRVWACVLLHEAGKKGDYIKKRLRWLSDCYRVYLRDTDTLAAQHNDCLREYDELIKAMRLTQIDLPDNVDYTVMEDDEMGTYDDPDG